MQYFRDKPDILSVELGHAFQQKRLSIVYGIYRVILAGFLFITFALLAKNADAFFIKPHFWFFAVYFIMVFIDILMIHSHKIQPFSNVFLQRYNTWMLVVDAGALSGLLFFNGGPDLQIALLFLVMMLSANFLLHYKMARIITGFTVIVVIYQLVLSFLQNSLMQSQLTPTLLLGIGAISTSAIARTVVVRLRNYEQINLENEVKINELRELNQSIIEKMSQGILVLNKKHQIVFLNQAARDKIQIKTYRQYMALHSHASVLSELIFNMRKQNKRKEYLLPSLEPKAMNGLSLNLFKIKSFKKEPLLLIFLEDLEQINQHAQQLKLQSLGRLTAGIAHEIRNPLAAISQASELLVEEVKQTDIELIQMIQKQAKRINQIIEDVLGLSRQQSIVPRRIKLKSWCEQTICEVLSDIKDDIKLHIQEELEIHFDPNHLEYILVNLVRNGHYHATKSGKFATVVIYASIERSGLIYLDVLDSGTGVEAEYIPSLFEPFFTTEKTGTGLGLYLSRTYAETNGAILSYVPSKVGACFRLEFAKESVEPTKELGAI